MNLSGNTATKRLKAVGGIIVLGSWFDENGNVVTAANDHRTTTGFNDILIENNVIQRVGLEGIRTKADSDTSRGNTFYKTFSNITIRNNYLEDIAGDGIVLSEAKSGGVVEGNVAVRMCNADYGTQNYAGVWAMSVDDGLFQYNEVYGIKYGFNDAEAYDVDMQSNNVIIILAAFYCLCLIKKIRLFGTISQLMTAVVTEEQVKTIQAELVATIIKNKAFSIIG